MAQMLMRNCCWDFFLVSKGRIVKYFCHNVSFQSSDFVKQFISVPQSNISLALFFHTEKLFFFRFSFAAWQNSQAISRIYHLGLINLGKFRPAKTNVWFSLYSAQWHVINSSLVWFSFRGVRNVCDDANWSCLNKRSDELELWADRMLFFVKSTHRKLKIETTRSLLKNDLSWNMNELHLACVAFELFL